MSKWALQVAVGSALTVIPWHAVLDVSFESVNYSAFLEGSDRASPTRHRITVLVRDTRSATHRADSATTVRGTAPDSPD